MGFRAHGSFAKGEVMLKSYLSFHYFLLQLARPAFGFSRLGAKSLELSFFLTDWVSRLWSELCFRGKLLVAQTLVSHGAKRLPRPSWLLVPWLHPFEAISFNVSCSGLGVSWSLKPVEFAQRQGLPGNSLFSGFHDIVCSHKLAALPELKSNWVQELN